MGRYICGDSILRLGAAGDHQPGETFEAQLSTEQERFLREAGALTVLTPSVQPTLVEAPVWQPPTPMPPGPGDDPKPIITPAPPADVSAAPVRRVNLVDSSKE